MEGNVSNARRNFFRSRICREMIIVFFSSNWLYLKCANEQKSRTESHDVDNRNSLIIMGGNKKIAALIFVHRINEAEFLHDLVKKTIVCSTETFQNLMKSENNYCFFLFNRLYL